MQEHQHCFECRRITGPIYYRSPTHKEIICEQCMTEYEYECRTQKWQRKKKIEMFDDKV